ncbi:MAG: alpha-amylase family glycosyl hydrolase [Hyalangium sp.]|uniref:alpha-amylase family glycosyl hydrolase n=1 Tax=Hyalangium sp. TaxID=2028555 RepID=UPI00389AA8F2
MAPPDTRSVSSAAASALTPLPASGSRVLGPIETLWLTGPVGAKARDFTQELQSLFAALEGAPHALSTLAAVTTRADAARLYEAALVINPLRAEELVLRFFEQVKAAREAQGPTVKAFFEALPEDWYADSPLYYTYPHSLGVKAGEAKGTLFELAKQLPYLRELGYRNIQVLPHWSSPGGDGGYDVSGFTVAEELGGEEAFRALMSEAMRLGMRIITDFIPNHISVRHPWFQALLAGDESKLSWFLPMNGVEWVGTEVDKKGKERVLLKSGSGNVMKPWAIFPHASKRNLLDVKVNGKGHLLFHSFYPFQVDLNLRNPDVLEELFKVIAWELNLGVVGKRMDAAPHWFKEEGTDFENLPGAHALQTLFKSFVRHVVGVGITVPEVGEGLEEASTYFGQKVRMLGKSCHSEGDAMFGFEWNSTLWALLLDEDGSLFWRFVDRMRAHGEGTFWFNLGRHHDELRTDLMPAGTRERVEAKLLQRGAEVFAGRGVGGRMANFLEKDPRQIAKAFFLNALPPQGTPVTYYGDEVGAENQPEYMAKEKARRLPILSELGFPTHDESVALDRRDIGRGSVYAEQLARAREAGYLPLRTVKALNALWAERASVRQGSVERVGDFGHRVISALKHDVKRQDAPLWALCNLSGETQSLSVEVSELRQKGLTAGSGTFTLRDVLAARRDGGAGVELRVEGERLSLTLEPHAHLLLEAASR